MALEEVVHEPDQRADWRLEPDVEQFLNQVDRQLEPFLQQAIDRVADVPQLKDGLIYQLRSGGKRIRAALCTTVCEVFSGSYLPSLPFAAAIEHLQNLTLIHDDIADGDAERRGQASAWKKYGLAHSINIGDIFIPLSSLAILEADYSPATRLQLLQALSRLGLTVAEGQSLDINLRRNDEPTVADYIEVTEQKTGGFFAMAAVGGGVIGGADQADLARLERFAHKAGVAFQIKDDVLDCTGGKGRLPGSDVVEGKRTLLAIFALEQAKNAERLRLLEILNQPPVLRRLTAT